jgi:hypothetical protein
MFQTIIDKDNGTTVIRCAVTDREHIFKTDNFGAKKNAREAAEQMQRAILAKLGYDPKTPQPVEVYRDRYATYQAKRGK